MDTAKIFEAGVDRLFSVFAQKIVQVTITNIGDNNYDPLTQTTANEEEVITCPALELSYEDKEVDNVRILQDDKKLMIRMKDLGVFVPSSESSITIGNKTYNVIRCKTQGVNTIAIIQARL